VGKGGGENCGVRKRVGKRKGKEAEKEKWDGEKEIGTRKAREKRVER
jgi:hypothetical protein